MVTPTVEIRKRMFMQGYRFVGKHSAVKICEWCKTSLRGKGHCYKEKFYGISSHRCVQMTPAVFSCTQNCDFCWRTMRFTNNKEMQWDSPISIVDGCIAEQQKILKGFFGNPGADKTKIYEAMHPNQFAVSLAGEPCLYPKLPELIETIKQRKATSFLVTNGTVPEMIAKLKKSQPTQLYVTLAAPNEEVHEKVCHPITGGAWNKLIETLGMLKDFDRTVIRLTLVKGRNMTKPEQYAEIVDKAGPMFVECKAFMSIGGARDRIGIESMPTHSEIMYFAKEIEKNSSYKIKDDKEDSRVVLLTK